MRFRAQAGVGAVALVVAALAGSAAHLEAGAAEPAASEQVVSPDAPGGVRFTLPKSNSSRGSFWTLVEGKVVGDLNGDRVPDLAFVVDHLEYARPDAPVNRAGSCGPVPHSRRVQVIFGGALPARVELGRPDVAGFRIGGGAETASLGASLAGVGDLDGDGLDDLAIGAPGDDDSGKGAVHVVYGKRSTDAVDVARLGDGGFTMTGSAASSQAGIVVAGGGDVNGDGRPDVLVGAKQRTAETIESGPNRSCGGAFMADRDPQRSVVYAVFGGARRGALDLGQLGADGFTIAASPRLRAAEGPWLANLGDVNGDRLADVGIGTKGGAIVVPGRNTTGVVDVGSARNVIELRVDNRRDAVPLRPIAGVGDVNGDGLADFALGRVHGGVIGLRVAPASAYLVFGRRRPAVIDADKLGRGGLIVRGNPGAGEAVLGLGDMNGDGVPDTGVSARSANGRALYVIYGRRSGGSISLPQLGSAGVRIDRAGGAGGAADVLPGARREVLVTSGESAVLVPFAPVAALPAPHVAARVDLGKLYAVALAGGFDSLWIGAGEKQGDRRAGYVLRLDPRTNRIVRRISTGGRPKVVATALGSVWALLVPRDRDRPATLLRIDPASGRVLYRRPVAGKGRDADQTPGPETITYGFGSLWITYGTTGRVYRVDPATGRTTAAIAVGHYPQALTLAGGRAWVADRADGAVRELDPATNRIVGEPLRVSSYEKKVDESLGELLWLGTHAGRVWIYDPSRPALVVLDPRTRRFAARPTTTTRSAATVAADGSTLWLVGSAERMSLDDGRLIGGSLELDTEPYATTFYAGSLWTTTSAANLLRVEAP